MGSGALREETLWGERWKARLDGFGAQFVKQMDDGRMQFYLPSYGLYAVVKKTFGGAWIGYYKDRNACGCG